jgi:hypothetical protein
MPSDLAILFSGAERQDRDRRHLRARLGHAPDDRAIAAGGDDDLGWVTQRLGKTASLCREIGDAITGAFE